MEELEKVKAESWSRQRRAGLRWLNYGESSRKIGVSAKLIHAPNMTNLAVPPIALFFSGTPLAQTDVGNVMFAAFVSSLWLLEQSVYFVHIRLLICKCLFSLRSFWFVYASNYWKHVFIFDTSFQLSI